MCLLNRMLSWLVYVAVILVMIFALCANFLVIAQALFEPLSVVKGNSMSPAIMTDDAVLMTGVDSGELAVGDVVIFNDPTNSEQSIVHRIISFEDENGSLFAVTKGDANPSNDPFAVPAASIQGKVRLVLPKGGIFLSYLRSIPGFIACVLCPFGVLLLYLIANWYLERTKPGGSLLALRLIHGS